MGGWKGDKGLEIMWHTSHKLMASDPLGCPTEEQAIPEGSKLLITWSWSPSWVSEGFASEHKDLDLCDL